MEPPWGGISCFLGSAALYLLGRSSVREAEVLKSVTRVDHLNGLSKLLDTKIKGLPLVVAISGRVGSETPISCENSGLRGVIVKETVRLIRPPTEKNDPGSKIDDQCSMVSRRKEVPWYLDDGTGRVFVVGARAATGFYLPVCSRGESGDSGRSLEYLLVLKMLGVERTEEVLPTGTSLTAVGEVIKDDNGRLRIQRPRNGPFYVSPNTPTIDQLIGNVENWARFYEYASAGLAAFGVFLLANHAIQFIAEKKLNC